MAAQKAADSRWITVREAYDHIWPSRASTNYPPGEYRVKNEVADRAIAKGKAVEGRLDGSEVTKKASKRKSPRSRKPATKASNAKASNTGSDTSLADPTVAAAGSAGDRSAVDTAAG